MIKSEDSLSCYNTFYQYIVRQGVAKESPFNFLCGSRCAMPCREKVDPLGRPPLTRAARITTTSTTTIITIITIIFVVIVSLVGKSLLIEGRKDHNHLYHHQHHHHRRCHRHHPLERAACANESLMDHKHSACKSRPSHLTSLSSSFAISEISALSLLVHATREKEEVAASRCY